MFSKLYGAFKIGTESELIFLQRRYANGQQTQEKVLNIISHGGNDNQNHKEISLHIHQYSYNKKAGNNKC